MIWIYIDLPISWATIPLVRHPLARLICCGWRLVLPIFEEHLERGKKLPHVRESKTVLDSGFHAVDSGFKVLDSRSFSVEFRFRIPYAVFRIPKSRILDSSCKNFSDSGIRIPLHNILRVVKAFSVKKVLIKSKSRAWKTYWKPLVLSLRQCAVIVSC